MIKSIWQTSEETLRRWERRYSRLFRIIRLITQGFTKSQIQQGASALTYYTLLALVPVIALLIGVARGFLFENKLKNWLLHEFQDKQTLIQEIFTFADASLNAASGGVLAAVGTLLLIWAAIKIFINIEFVMNQIWEVSKGRPLARRLVDYMALLFLAPVILFLALGLTGYLSATLSNLAEKSSLFERLFLLILLSLIPSLLTFLLFLFLYIFMPNTQVKLVPALLAAGITASIYQVLQWVYLYFQIGVSSANAVYGAFAAIPLFLIWLHLSWVVILLGAKICFSIQNVKAYASIVEDEKLSNQCIQVCTLRIAHFVIKCFWKEKPPPTLTDISHELSIPHSLSAHLLSKLVASGVLIVVKRDDQSEAYQPARSVEQLTIKKVIDMLNTQGEELSLPPSQELKILLNSLDKFHHALEKSEGNRLLKDI